MAEDRYKIVKYRMKGTKTAMRGLGNLTLEEAKRYCRKPEAHGDGWFCGFTKAGRN
jgi:hypothetical protein